MVLFLSKVWDMLVPCVLNSIYAKFVNKRLLMNMTYLKWENLEISWKFISINWVIKKNRKSIEKIKRIKEVHHHLHLIRKEKYKKPVRNARKIDLLLPALQFPNQNQKIKNVIREKIQVKNVIIKWNHAAKRIVLKWWQEKCHGN